MVLYLNDFGYIWKLQQVTSEKHFLTMFQERLKDQYLQAWYNSIRLNSRLCLYSEFKSSYFYEPYVTVVTIRK